MTDLALSTGAPRFIARLRQARAVPKSARPLISSTKKARHPAAHVRLQPLPQSEAHKDDELIEDDDIALNRRVVQWRWGALRSSLYLRHLRRRVREAGDDVDNEEREEEAAALMASSMRPTSTSKGPPPLKFQQAVKKLVTTRRSKIESFFDQITSLQNAVGEAMTTLKQTNCKKRPPPLVGIRVGRRNSSSLTPSNRSRRGSRRRSVIVASPLALVTHSTSSRKCASSSRRTSSGSFGPWPTGSDGSPGSIPVDLKTVHESRPSPTKFGWGVGGPQSPVQFGSPQMRCLPGVGFHLVRTRALPGKPLQPCEALVSRAWRRADLTCQIDSLSGTTSRISLM